jgi:hypothetical protein
MAVLSWGKPTVEFKKTTDTSSDWGTFAEIVEDSASLEVTEGELIQATEEGGGVVDSRRKRNQYKFSLELFVKKGDTRPIADVDGVIADNYAVRLTPEDATCEGFILDKTNVSVSESWTAANGKRLRYTFDGIKPDDKTAICKPYTKTATE